MTIATSVVVHPSSSLRLALAAMSCAAACSAVFLLLTGVSDSLCLVRIAAGLICGMLAGAGFFQVFRSTKTFHIDISGIGQMRLTQYSEVSAVAHAIHPPLDAQGAVPVQLLGDSTLWPHLLVLRVKPEHGPVVAIPVLPDSMRSESFHDLAVACRWIAARAVADVIGGEQ